jgi:gluconolactonase
MMLLIEASVQASGLGFPEGPLVLPDGRLAFVEEYNGCVSVIEDGRARVMAHVGGNPNGLALGADGRIYVTRGRGVVGDWHLDPPAAPAIVVVDPADGSCEVVTTTASGRALRAPNDLCFGPDGMLYFTDPDDFDPAGDLHGWLCRTGPNGTELLYELGNTFPNGLAYDAAGRLVWMESHTKRVIGATSDGGWETLAQLAPETTPDGCAYAADGRLVVATLFTGGLDVVEWTADGTSIERITWTDDGAVNTNCCFQGSSIWVTDVGVGWASARDTGRLWRLETTLTGLPL